jgi:hypothetical protein
MKTAWVLLAMTSISGVAYSSVIPHKSAPIVASVIMTAPQALSAEEVQQLAPLVPSRSELMLAPFKQPAAAVPKEKAAAPAEVQTSTLDVVTYESSPSSPPLDTDDPGTPGKNAAEYNFIADCDYAKGQRGCSQGIDAAFGIGSTTQFRINRSFVQESADGSPNFKGVTATNVGVKWRFYNQPGLQVAIYPGYQFNDDTRHSQPDGTKEGDGRGIYLPLIVAIPVGSKTTIVGNIGQTFNLDYPHSGSTFTSIAIGRGISPTLRLMSEVTSTKDLTGRLTYVRVGFVKVIMPKESDKYERAISLSVGRTVGLTPDRLTHTGIRLTFTLARKPH